MEVIEKEITYIEKTYVSDDGKEFKNERDCLHHEKETKIFNAYHFDFDMDKVLNYKPEHWEHVKFYFLSQCYGHHGVFIGHGKRLRNSQVKYFPDLYNAIDSEEKLKEAILKVSFHQNNVDRHQAEHAKTHLVLDVPEYSSEDFFFTLYKNLFGNKNRILNDSLDKAEDFVERTLATNLYMSGMNASNSKSQLPSILEDELDYPANTVFLHLYAHLRQNNKEGTKKLANKNLIKGFDSPDNSGRLLCYVDEETEKQLCKLMDQVFIKQGQDVDKFVLHCISQALVKPDYREKYSGLSTLMINPLFYTFRWIKRKKKIESNFKDIAFEDLYKFFMATVHTSDIYLDGAELTSLLPESVVKYIIENQRFPPWFLHKILEHYPEEYIINNILEFGVSEYNFTDKYIEETFAVYKKAKVLFKDFIDEKYKGKTLIPHHADRYARQRGQSVITLKKDIAQKEIRSWEGQNVVFYSESGMYTFETTVNQVIVKRKNSYEEIIKEGTEIKLHFDGRL